ncbi:WhiB family transcriptional regulator [Nocardia sp. AG03]|uniref:WhiB family transcriptional regulator n=1 Tax=Nocardia sp. AG03 TaxID=3025312 RepID=UPI0024185CFE|nr:WhiB family transcriptional regulator [Nocardia sp. AG03]
MTGRRPPTETFRALIDPRLDGAACKGMAPWFDIDPDDSATADRIATAARVCGRCPVQAACETAVSEQQRPAGVWAGKAYGIPARRRGRPRKGAA